MFSAPLFKCFNFGKNLLSLSSGLSTKKSWGEWRVKIWKSGVFFLSFLLLLLPSSHLRFDTNQSFSCVCYFFSCYCYFRVSFQISKMRNETSSLLISRCYLLISCDKSSKNQINCIYFKLQTLQKKFVVGRKGVEFISHFRTSFYYFSTSAYTANVSTGFWNVYLGALN